MATSVTPRDFAILALDSPDKYRWGSDSFSAGVSRCCMPSLAHQQIRIKTYAKLPAGVHFCNVKIVGVAKAMKDPKEVTLRKALKAYERKFERTADTLRRVGLVDGPIAQRLRRIGQQMDSAQKALDDYLAQKK